MGMLGWVDTINELRFLVPTEVLMEYYYSSMGILKYINAWIDRLAIAEQVSEESKIKGMKPKPEDYGVRLVVDRAKLDNKQFNQIKTLLDELIEQNHKLSYSKQLRELGDKEIDLEFELTKAKENQDANAIAQIGEQLKVLRSQYNTLIDKAGMSQEGIELLQTGPFAAIMPYLEDKGLISIPAEEVKAFKEYRNPKPKEDKFKGKRKPRIRKR